jgi:hypothetical protein
VSYKAPPRFTKPTEIILSNERRRLVPIYEAFAARSATRLTELRAAVDAGKAVKS